MNSLELQPKCNPRVVDAMVFGKMDVAHTVADASSDMRREVGKIAQFCWGCRRYAVRRMRSIQNC